MKQDLRSALRERVIIGDGAMGTYLYQLGFPVGISYEEINLTKPEVIADVHRRYYEAGARLIETNTFSANREKLSKYGLEDEVENINRAAVRIARQAAGDDAYIAGAVGSIRGGRRSDIAVEELRRNFDQQIRVLIEEGVDAILLETFYDLEEMLLALSVVRGISSDLPVIAQFAMEDVGRTQDGYTVQEAFDQAVQSGADIVGFNCRSGPYGIMRAMDKLRDRQPVPMSVFPNAGIPDLVDGRVEFIATPGYFAECAVMFAERGMRIIGGCCGTTPEHIAAMAQALQGRDLKSLAGQGVRASEPGASGADETKAETAALDRPTRGRVIVGEEPEAPASGSAAEAVKQPPREPSIVELVRQRHTVIVELDPPRDLTIDRFMRGAEALRDAGADMITLADNSLAVTRMNNMALGHLMHERVGIRPLVHIACRDRNLIGTQSHMMGLHALGIDHVLAVTGDPARIGDLPGSSSVYDLTSFEMIRMIKQLNEGIAFSGKPLKQRANFVVGAAFNPNVKHLDKAVKRLERKVEAGADFIMTQPVYDPALFQQIAEMTEHIPIPIFIGIMPLASGRNAEFLHNEVPGIKLSDDVRARMAGLEGEDGRKAGVAIAKELLDEAMRWFKGIYLMTPFLAYEMTVQLVEHVWEAVPRYAPNQS
ncbi:bifunctional homocysteine S-methyltransferase/methylenetetrahydrofolate reductase [Insulibacter thermoxylanivorax]|uniref:Bifunctional homocysteine S-methyltransferase/methylenetetrahydrofolate reductase n=1 Tax=Insulibacter thermoxylanivorax TaxID=2749268 RepID=A0A916VFU5_9BACL|nr:bifunctional homocysteine S-methyltransferase/methylenetetrahydrofolate reductase [Insulibacter thermoxylanivorax]GFR37806.1 bifunctional homocysteine S-methyltransferase/methylenetetrahydrofolate reductase [Insulibacter thermoxylanivorax]